MEILCQPCKWFPPYHLYLLLCSVSLRLYCVTLSDIQIGDHLLIDSIKGNDRDGLIDIDMANGQAYNLFFDTHGETLGPGMFATQSRLYLYANKHMREYQLSACASAKRLTTKPSYTLNSWMRKSNHACAEIENYQIEEIDLSSGNLMMVIYSMSHCWLKCSGNGHLFLYDPWSDLLSSGQWSVCMSCKNHNTPHTQTIIAPKSFIRSRIYLC